jgi:hypothetical protein
MVVNIKPRIVPPPLVYFGILKQILPLELENCWRFAKVEEKTDAQASPVNNVPLLCEVLNNRCAE